jgi:hypothetical protein
VGDCPLAKVKAIQHNTTTKYSVCEPHLQIKLKFTKLATMSELGSCPIALKKADLIDKGSFLSAPINQTSS